MEIWIQKNFVYRVIQILECDSEVIEIKKRYIKHLSSKELDFRVR